MSELRPNEVPGRHGAVLLQAASLVVVVAGLKAAEALLVPLVFAAFLAVLCAPPVVALTRLKLPTWIGIPLVMLGVTTALVLFGGLVGASLSDLVVAAPRYQERFEALLAPYSGTLEWFGLSVSRELVEETLRSETVVALVGGTLSELATLLSNTLLIVLTVVFLLFELTALPTKIRAALGNPSADLSEFSHVIADVKNYILIKTYVSLATGLVVWGMLALLGVDFALVWGLLAFVLNYIPNIGSIVAAVPPILLSAVQTGLGTALLVLLGFVVINLVIGNLIEPVLLGRRLGLSSLVVLLSLVAWGWLWGPGGMLLSVPLTMVIKILLEHSAQWRWLAILMEQSDNLTKPPVSTRFSIAPRARRQETEAEPKSDPR